jgi:hypothetical protein
MEARTEGACLCGKVRYAMAGPFTAMSHCHCSMCRKHHGSAFATFAIAPIEGFRWLAGEHAPAATVPPSRVNGCSARRADP